MTLPELLKLSTDQLERMTSDDLMKELGHLLPAVRTPIEGMAGATDTTVKTKADGDRSTFVSPKSQKIDDMVAQLKKMQKMGSI